MLSPEEILPLKSAIKQACLAVLAQRIVTARTAMDVAQESANNQEKSSAGDKYETSRAMGQIDRDMNARQLEQAQNEHRLLESIPVDKLHSTVSPGSLFAINGQLFFAGVGIGNITVDGKQIVAVSLRSPVYLGARDGKVDSW